MSLIQDALLALEQKKKTPLAGLLEGFAGGFAQAQSKSVENARNMLLMQQEMDNQRRLAEQDQMMRKMMQASEQQTVNGMRSTATPSTSPFASQRLQMGIESDPKTGFYRPKFETVTPKADSFQLKEYADSKGVARLGKLNSTTGEFIQTPNDPAAPVARNSETDPIKRAKDLRNEFTDLSKDYFKVNESVARVRASAKDPSAAGDLALIFNYMKILDPGSVVREGEFATAQNAAGVPARIVAQYNKVLSGERLAPETRDDFLDRAERLFEESKSVHGRREKEYTRLAHEVGADPRQVIINQSLDSAVRPQAQNQQPTNAPRQISNQEEYDALPKGAQYVDPEGNVRRKK